MPHSDTVLSSSLELEARLLRLNDRIEAACRRCGRERQDVRLVLATKYASVEQLAKMPKFQGRCIFGENRVQAALVKKRFFAEAERQDISFHFIGHLQTNKVAALLPHIELLHSLDRIGLAEAIEKFCVRQAATCRVLLQVNTSGEDSKFGFSPDEALSALEVLAKCEHLRISGLMTMAPFTSDETIIRSSFSRLRIVADELATHAHDRGYEHMSFKELSMGMTRDFELAIEEGATLIRVGSAIFK